MNMTALSNGAMAGLSNGSVQGTRDMNSPAAENQKLREDLALAYRALVYYNLHEGIDNHLSVIAPSRSGSGEVMLIIPYGLHWGQVTASSLVGVDVATGKTVEGDGKIGFAAMNVHLDLHKAKAPEGYRCVMHTHQPYTTAITCCHGRMKNCHQNSMRFHNKIGYKDSYIPPSAHAGKKMAEGFVGKRICFLANHGVIACGRRICDAFDDLYFLEQACKFQVLAMSTGMDPVEVSDEEAEVIADWEDMDSLKELHFEALRPIIARMEPDYLS